MSGCQRGVLSNTGQFNEKWRRVVCISAINQFFWLQPSFNLMCPSWNTPGQLQPKRPDVPAWKFKLRCHDQGVNNDHYAHHQLLNSNVPRIFTGARIPTTKQFSPRQQKHCCSHNCLVQLIKCMELNMQTNHNQNGQKLQTHRMVGYSEDHSSPQTNPSASPKHPSAKPTARWISHQLATFRTPTDMTFCYGFRSVRTQAKHCS